MMTHACLWSWHLKSRDRDQKFRMGHYCWVWGHSRLHGTWSQPQHQKLKINAYPWQLWSLCACLWLHPLRTAWRRKIQMGLIPRPQSWFKIWKWTPPPPKKKIQKGTGNFNRQKRHLIKFSVLLTKTSKPHRRELAVPEDRCKYPDSAS